MDRFATHFGHFAYSSISGKQQKENKSLKNNLKEIFDNNYSALCNYAHTFVNDKHLAEDIVQSVFIQLWENQKIFQLKSPEPYLLKCVRYKCIDYLKKPNRKREMLTDNLPNLKTEEVSSLKEADILPMLHYFADKLPSKMRKVFLMSRQQGMSYKEIAAELNISIKTVENQMGSALKKLRVLLQEHHYLPTLLFFLQ